MSVILNIDTAVQTASVCLAGENDVLGLQINASQKDHAAWLHIAIRELLHESQTSFDQLSAIAVSSGPGSYTGLRVGMAAAKGLCYTLQLPLLAVNTLMLMANSARLHTDALLCPMIDARRMEVFTAIYGHELEELLPSTNMILDENSFAARLNEERILFFGNGSEKFQGIIRHTNAIFKTVNTTAVDMISLSLEKFNRKDFTDLAYSEPFYGKDFHSPVKQSL